MALQEFEAVDREAQRKKNIVRAVERVAERLGNTPAICRKSYVHPAVLDSYLDALLITHSSSASNTSSPARSKTSGPRRRPCSAC
jgi:DNA topoisomerase IB